MRNSLWRELLHDAATPSRLFPALSSALVVGLLIIVIELSLASLIFSGPLAHFAPQAAGMTLFGGFAMCLVLSLFSSLPASIGAPQDSPAAILASAAAGMAASLAAAGVALDSRAAFVTVGAAMGLSTICTGAMFALLGRFRLGNLVRYIPYPVVGGFMAGVGWLLARGSFAIMVDVPLGLDGLPRLMEPGIIARWSPGLAMALCLLLGLSRLRHAAVLPGTLGLALAGFAAWLSLTGRSLAEAEQAGLLLGDMPEGAMLWPVLTPADLGLVRWDALARELPHLLTIPLVASMSFMLACSGLEAAFRHDLDMRRDMYVNAAANFLVGAGGAHTGFTALSLSMIGTMTGANSRLVGVGAALLVGAATFFGAGVLGSVPRFLLGGLVLFMGLSMLANWAVETRKSVTPMEHVVILVILCAIGVLGFLPGVAVGLVLAALLFVVKYSRIPVVRLDTDLRALASARRRSVPDRHVLRGRAEAARLLRVSGFLFFGSANTLSRAVSEHLALPEGARPDFLVLDFTEVDGFDSSAMNSFVRMVQRCEAAGSALAFAAAPASLERQMLRSAPAEARAARFFPDLDRALEWCEDAILEREYARLEAGKAEGGQDALFDSAVDDMLRQLEQGERFEALLERLQPHLARRTAAAGEVILRQGEAPDGVLLFVSGQAEEARRTPGGAASRLRTLGPGGMAGQAGESSDFRAPGEITALTDCSLAFLPARKLAELERVAPEAALAFYRLYASLLEARQADQERPRLGGARGDGDAPA